MPDEIDVPIDDVREHVDHLHEEKTHEKHSHDGDPKADWTKSVALSTAVLAALAAVGALQSGLLINESLLQKNEQVAHLTVASDKWNYYQAEGLKSLIYRTSAQGLPRNAAAKKQYEVLADHYASKQTDLKSDAEKTERQAEDENRASEHFLAKHHIFAFSVSLSQIAIALSAVAALTKRRRFWLIGLAIGAVGAFLLVYGFI